jgi:hypothetical protein
MSIVDATLTLGVSGSNIVDTGDTTPADGSVEQLHNVETAITNALVKVHF